MQPGPKRIQVSTCAIIISGKLSEYNEIWELVIPLKNMKNLHKWAYYAAGIRYITKHVIGIRATVDGGEWDYGIYTRNPEKLFEVIDQAKAKLDAQPPPYEDLQRNHQQHSTSSGHKP